MVWGYTETDKQNILAVIPKWPGYVTTKEIYKSLKKKNMNYPKNHINGAISEMVRERPPKVCKRPPTTQERRIGRSLDLRIRMIYFRPAEE